MIESICRPPVIILGMHRSGTTLLVEVLRGLGLFCGARLDENGEAVFFIRINEWLLRSAGGSWFYPLPFRRMKESPELVAKAVERLRKALNSRLFSEYTGSLPHKLLNCCPPLRTPWGWKDPRNVFTARLWLALFPNARVLYIKRNGIDVAQSLCVREQKLLENWRRGSFLDRLPIFRSRSISKGFQDYYQFPSPRSLTLRENFALWEEYTDEAETLLDGLPGPKLALRYEDFLDRPKHFIPLLADFCGLRAEASAVERSAAVVNCSRSFAFLSNPMLCRLYQEVRDTELMVKLGYDGELRRRRSKHQTRSHS